LKKRSRLDIWADIQVLKRSDVEAIHAKNVVMKKRSKASSVYADNLRIEPGSRVTGEVLYTGNLDAEEAMPFAKEPKKVHSLPA